MKEVIIKIMNFLCACAFANILLKTWKKTESDYEDRLL